MRDKNVLTPHCLSFSGLPHKTPSLPAIIYLCLALGCRTFAYLLVPLIPGMASVTFTNVMCRCFFPFAIGSSRSPVWIPMTVHISPLLSLSLVNADISLLFSVTACIHSSRSWFHKSGGAIKVHLHVFLFTAFLYFPFFRFLQQTSD